MNAEKWEGLKCRLGGPAGLDPVCSGSRAGFGGRECSDCVRMPGKADCPSLLQKPSTEQPLYSSSLWGPVANGCDCVAEGLWLPQLHVGDRQAAAAREEGTAASPTSRIETALVGEGLGTALSPPDTEAPVCPPTFETPRIW